MELAIATAALALLEKLIPVITDMVKSGDVTPQEQQDLLNRYNSLKTKADGQFSGPEWQVEP